MTPRARQRLAWWGALSWGLLPAPALAQTPVGTAFTYQGRLTDSGSPASGAYDLRFILYNADTGGSQVGPVLTRDDVTVTAGLFMVSLDFGAAFDGDKRFLEIAARPGASTGSFSVLSPRQELTPAPLALRASDAASAATVAGLGCANGQVLKWVGATWSCAADVVGSGTVTSVGTGAGLTGGPITATGTISVAAGGISSGMIASGAVGSNQIASGAVGLTQINQTQVQSRVSGTCPAGQYLRGINPDGSVVCEPFLAPPAITTVDDPANVVGSHTSIAIGADGLPVISYVDESADALKVAKCANPACTGVSAVTTVDDAANLIGHSTSIAIGADGLPAISYHDLTAGTLKVAKCANAACTGASTITIVDDPVNVVGSHASIAIGTDGRPVISYYDTTAQALKVAKCANAVCAGVSTINTVDDPGNNVGQHTSITIGSDDLPVISYYDSTVGALKVAKCGNTSCTGASTITVVDDVGNNVGQYTSIAIGTDSLPVVSYSNSTTGALRVAKCANTSCTGTSTITTVDDPANLVGYYTSIAIGADGLPVISYWDATAGALKVAKCANASCTGNSAITTVDDPANQVGSFSSIAIGSDGLPVISYTDNTAQALKVAKCGTQSCQ